MYGVLLAGERVVALAQPRAHALHAHDTLLLSSFVLGSDSFRAAAESFSPICLPRFNPAAFLHAYVRFLDEVRFSSDLHASTRPSCCRFCILFSVPAHISLLLTHLLGWSLAQSPNCTLTACLEAKRDFPSKYFCMCMQASGLCLVLLSTHQDAFHSLSDAAKRLQAELHDEGAFQVRQLSSCAILHSSETWCVSTHCRRPG